jgi:predicted double-glycine peptidase
MKAPNEMSEIASYTPLLKTAQTKAKRVNMFPSHALQTARASALILIAGGLLLGADRPANHGQQSHECAILVPIPLGTIKIPLRDVQQPDDYSCGAAAFMSICSYYNVGPRNIEVLKKELHTDPDEGTYYKNISQFAEKLGLKADLETPMSLARLKELIDQGKPVICSIQAYSNKKHPDYTKNDDGHYVVAIGYDKQENFYFMDPSANYEGVVANPRYGCLSKAEFELRWHENEGMHGAQEVYSKLGIAIYPDPKNGGSLLRARKIE